MTAHLTKFAALAKKVYSTSDCQLDDSSRTPTKPTTLTPQLLRQPNVQPDATSSNTSKNSDGLFEPLEPFREAPFFYLLGARSRLYQSRLLKLHFSALNFFGIHNIFCNIWIFNDLSELFAAMLRGSAQVLLNFTRHN